MSCIIWTLTLQTTIKYVWLTLKADNKGEGGIFSLYALVRRQKRWLVLPAMIGGAALLGRWHDHTAHFRYFCYRRFATDAGVERYQQTTIVYIVLGIMVILFFLQQFGTESIGKLFGPIMFVWFSMMAVLGSSHLLDDLHIFKALSPHYAIELLTTYPKGFWILGCRISVYHRSRSTVFRPWSLRPRQYPHFMDIRKNLPDPELSWTRCLVACAS